MVVHQLKVRCLKALALAVAILGGAATVSAEPPATQSSAAEVQPMRTRLLTSLTGYEVDEYIKRNDIIYVPFGPTEVHGSFPVDIEYVVPLAYAIKLAAKTDGLVFPYLAYTYPGGTTTSHGTVYTSTSESLPFLKSLTRSLIRQGFHRIIFLSAHTPASNTMTPLVREIYDEMHVPVVWMGTEMVHGGVPGIPARGAGGAGIAAEMERARAEHEKILYGALLAVGRLDDVPVGMTEPVRPKIPDPAGFALLRLTGFANSTFGRWFADPSDHAGYVTPITAEQRDAYAKAGLAKIDADVAAFDAAGLVAAIRGEIDFTKFMEKKYGDLLPPGPVAP